jgi:hypothetical protein
MSEQNQAEEQFDNIDGEENTSAPDEKKMLMQRLRLMNVSFSNAASVETLRAKLKEKLGVTDEAPVETDDSEDEEEVFEEIQESKTELEAETETETEDDQHEGSKESPDSLSADEKAELEALRAKVYSLEAERQRITSEALNPLAGDKAGATPSKHMTKRDLVRKNALKLVRVRIANMDPKKKDLPGEVLSVANRYIGTVKKYIPYTAEQTENGYHIPQVLYDELDSRRYLHIRTFKDRQTGQQRQETSWQKEFALEVLPPLTIQELAELKAAQQARGSNS